MPDITAANTANAPPTKAVLHAVNTIINSNTATATASAHLVNLSRSCSKIDQDKAQKMRKGNLVTNNAVCNKPVRQATVNSIISG